MANIYMAHYVCKRVIPIGLPGYNNVVLGLPVGNGNSDILIKATVARFVVDKGYFIKISEEQNEY
jgi:hypothetical protein